MGVVTRDDLEKFVARRGGGSREGQAAAGGSGILPTSAQAHVMARRAEEEARKNRTLSEFLLMLDGYTPLVSCTVPLTPGLVSPALPSLDPG